MPDRDRSFDLHEIADFPIVYASLRERAPGTAEQWQWEMETLIARGEAFIIIFPPDFDGDGAPQTEERKKQAREGKRLRARWLKDNRRILAAVCKGLIGIEENSVRRALETARSALVAKAFGIPFKVAASRQEAEQLGRALLGPPQRDGASTP